LRITSINLAVYGFEAITRALARGMREVEINSMARVIFCVARTLLIRRLVSRSSALAIGA
jgi:hypothetical protein